MSLPFGRITGKNVVANGVPALSQIQLDYGASANPTFASNVAGADRGAGNIFIRGAYSAWGHTPPTGVFPGKTLALSFTITGITGGGNGEVASVPAVMCTRLQVVVPTYDPQQRNRVYYVVHFGPAGYDLAITTAAPPTDAAAPSFENVKGLGCSLSGTPLDGVQDMELDIRNLAQEDIDSSYNGIWYVPEGNIDWSFTVHRAVSALASLPTVNSVCPILMNVTPSLNWGINYGRVLTAGKAVFNRAQTRVLSHESVLEKCSYGTSSGSILNPAGTSLWP